MTRNRDQFEPGNCPRIFIPLLHDYYIFDYLRFLIPRLLDGGFAVTLYAFDSASGRKYHVDHPRFRFVKGGSWLRALNNRHKRILPRILLWLSGWIWSAHMARRYDFAIVPWDYRPLWYVIARRMPSLTLSTTTIMLDKTLELEDRRLDPVHRGGFWHRLASLVDALSSGRFLPWVAEELEAYPLKLLFVDRLMGWRAMNHVLGSSGATFVCVPGETIRDNFINFGIPACRVKVVGIPNYEFLQDLRRDFDADARSHFAAEYGLDLNKKVFTFFLSPPAFSQEMIDEVHLVVGRIRSHHPDSFFVIKFHPKTRAIDPPRFRDKLKELGDDLRLLTDFGGDELNARLVLCSHAIVQKQSTVGFIAMILKVPIISYDILVTGYQDRMYKLLECSLHAESLEELDGVLAALETSEVRNELRRKQTVACRRFCLDVPSPCGQICDLIQGYFRAEPYVPEYNAAND